MTEDSAELNGLEIKPYITTQMNCRTAAAGYVMEALNSNLSLNLDSYPGVLKATIIFSRISGNGKVKINEINTEVLSKNFHQIDLGIISDKKLHFSRSQDSIGKIVINKIILINVESVAAKLSADETIKSANTLKKFNENWKNVLIKYGSVRGIKLINDRIYASEGAQIAHANIVELIETEPAQSFVTSNVIKFIYPCEITAAYFKNEFEISMKQEAKYKHFLKPPDIQSNTFISTSNISNKISAAINNMNTSKNNIIYDSSVSKLEPSFFINSKEIIGGYGKNNEGLLLKREAEFSIPIADLKPNMQYIIIASLRKINGNGKFGAAITTSEGQIRTSSVIIAPDRESDITLKLNTEVPPNAGSSYSLKIFRPSDSTIGDVLLERIIIIEGINTTSAQSGDSINQASLSSKIYTADFVKLNSKKYSRKTLYTENKIKFDHSGLINLNSKSSISWFNKLSPICPNIKEDKNAKIVFGELGSLTAGEKIWIEPFNESIISEADNSILSKASLLISSSSQNIEFLKNLYPKVKCHLLERVWPSIVPAYLPYPSNDYVVMFHRTKKNTDAIIDAYDSRNNPPLVIIGATENYPDFVIPMNEYISYDKVLGVLFNAKLLIDVCEINNYISGILSIAVDAGLPILSSNKCYSGVANFDYLPQISDINIEMISSLKNKKMNPSKRHNEKLDKMLSFLFEN